MSETAEDERNATVDRNAATPVARPISEEATAIAKPLGFIGLGAMGLPMAVCAARRHALLACDTDPVRLALLVEELGQPRTLHTTPVAVEVGQRCEVVVLMLPSSREVATVVTALAPVLPAGALVIDMGSSTPGETRRLAAELALRDVHMIDAPVSGGIAKAKDGTLSILVGGADAAVTAALPYLQSMGETIIRTGAVGSGHAMKALNNFVYAAGLLAVVEALRLGEAEGLDRDLLADVLNASSGRNVATETKLKQFILPGDYGGGFRLGLMAKDLENAVSIARENGIEAASLAACHDAWQRALDALGPDADNTEIHRTIGTRPVA